MLTILVFSGEAQRENTKRKRRTEKKEKDRSDDKQSKERSKRKTQGQEGQGQREREKQHIRGGNSCWELEAAGSQLLDRFSGADERDQDTGVTVAFRDFSGILAEDNGKFEDKRVDNRQMGVQGFSNEFSGNAVAQNLAGIAKRKVERMPRLAEEQNNKILPSKEKSKEKGDNNGDAKQKDRGRDNKKAIKLTKKRKGRRNGRKVGAKVKLRKACRSDPRILAGMRLIIVACFTDSEVRHNKLQRLTFHQLTENGTKLESARVHYLSALDKQGVPNNFPLDNKDSKVNGIIEAHKLSTKPKPSAVSMFGDQIVVASKKSPLPDSKHVNGIPNESMMEDQIDEASNRPPHPDTKYLSEILSVPKMETWSGPMLRTRNGCLPRKSLHQIAR
ncbi:unnamed protein product [Fraxinus pennsylvanica]|uniref:Uncharacterized protein n=1 Tax=Fraxinus pennsylvanica TaxID=56036 RepID=A0AAD1ZHE1_9LAMI|nr:unnamed protein product [Fraxinus pennsylvanica]